MTAKAPDALKKSSESSTRSAEEPTANRVGLLVKSLLPSFVLIPGTPPGWISAPGRVEAKIQNSTADGRGQPDSIAPAPLPANDSRAA